MSHRDRVNYDLDVFITKHPEIKNVLDSGCGAWNFKRFFENRNINWTGIDIQPFPNVTWGDHHCMPFNKYKIWKDGDDIWVRCTK